MKKIIFAIVAAVMVTGAGLPASAQKAAKTETVVFDTNIHCNNCKAKIENKLPFEKGVKDVQITVADKTVKVTYDPAKTDAAKLKAAIEKLGYKAEAAKTETAPKK